MALPEIISLQPLTRLPRVEVVVPGSKSITNRALILAVLREGVTSLRGALWSEDTQVMVLCLRTLGFEIAVESDLAEGSNRTLIVHGRGGRIPAGGSVESPLELFVGNAGTAARFLTALVCLGDGCYRLAGIDRMHDRPQSGLIHALRRLGYEVKSENDRLPVVVEGAGLKQALCEVDSLESSQFASALLLASEAGGWKVRLKGQSADQSPYVKMTVELMAAMKQGGRKFQIEPDASSGSYFWALNALGLPLEGENGVADDRLNVKVQNWPESGWQVDAEFPKFLNYDGELSRERDLGDSIMTAIVLAALRNTPRRFVDLGRLRVQECERVVALRTELGKCGAHVIEEGDTLVVEPGEHRSASVETYNDHRMAMCFALIGLCRSGIEIRDPGCVRKTFPSFFQKLAAPPPCGLGATIWDAQSGRRLQNEGLAAD
ncbi:MAG: 3-phosphoshikimate 1-carboxyvinyltransferase [Verrucomicrobia subdivision 3 bacterium]|nr:3-phosphoshikimate 1-carboxyvinyltransferase [Limisphaerales bacterium]MCS1412780.1 3-phosphoshikimate 1-carboxyvinyltransferase [Limisphaerales bacterium]